MWDVDVTYVYLHCVCGIFVQKIRISLYYGTLLSPLIFPHPKWSPDADSPYHSDSPPDLPSHVQHESPKEEGLAKDSPAESGMCMYMYYSWAQYILHPSPPLQMYNCF